MPQLDVYSYFSTTTVVILSFLSLLFIMHTYFLPKIAQCLKFRNKYVKNPRVIFYNQFIYPQHKHNLKKTKTLDAISPSSCLNGYLMELDTKLNKVK